jgi:23S rRNA (cytidine1920-2'-O)/16S rRNA (cytidine1409-2'-O)-methyltransferase
LPTAGLLPSPLVGTRGNHEYLVWLNAAQGSNPTQWRDRVHSSAGFGRD